MPAGKEDDGREVFKNTPDMMRLFSEKIGVRYPYAKYSQVVVQDFIFGGMENVSATTLTDTILYDARARLDQDADCAGGARAGAPVVRRPAHLPRLVARLAQRGLRHVHGAGLLHEHHKGRDEYL